jgi:hypothetical protein
MERNKKLGVIVPYRKREQHLKIFLKRIVRYLTNEGIDHEVIIVEQDDAHIFNRGMLLNIGFQHAKKLRCNYVVFHDVDMLPSDVDYSYSTTPIHLATNLEDQKTHKPSSEIFDEYFGGVTLFPIEDFETINGYSNKYWGWGYEDTDLLYRCKKKGIELDTFKLRNFNRKGIKLKFNGVDSYIKGKNFNNLINLNSDLTIFISFYPDEIYLNHTKEKDDFTIFSLSSGYNTEISYNSFQRYNFTTFDRNLEVLYVNSKIKTNYKTNICVTFNSNEKKINVFQDGILIDTISYERKLYNYILEQIFYIGCTNDPNTGFKNFFKGYFDQFAVFSNKLEDDEVYEISTSDDISLTQNRGKYKSATKLKVCYDSNYIKNYKIVDLSGNENDGEIFNCEIVELDIDEFKEVKIPHRRKSLFTTLTHETNGFEDNKWKRSETRWNQLRFHNEVSKNDDLLENDGLSDLNYTLYNKKRKDNISHIKVGL